MRLVNLPLSKCTDNVFLESEAGRKPGQALERGFSIV
jgi:hypothetical protein